MKNISIEMLIFFFGTIISGENVEQQNPNYLMTPPTASYATRPAFHPLSVVKYRNEVITEIQEEDVATDIEGETRVEAPEERNWLKWCYICCCGKDDND